MRLTRADSCRCRTEATAGIVTAVASGVAYSALPAKTGAARSAPPLTEAQGRSQHRTHSTSMVAVRDSPTSVLNIALYRY